MDGYTIYCTEAQTKKALELGAPIYVTPMVDFFRDEIGKSFFLNGGNACWFPTAEQMIAWLEDQENIILHIKPFYRKDGFTMGYEYVISADNIPFISNKIFYDYSRKEATLAAIDAALEYLS